MALLRTLTRMAIQRLASDPELQQKVKDTIKHEVLPKAREKWSNVKPEIKKAALKGRNLVKDIGNSMTK